MRQFESDEFVERIQGVIIVEIIVLGHDPFGYEVSRTEKRLLFNGEAIRVMQNVI